MPLPRDGLMLRARPERRRRGDLVATAAIVVSIVVAATVLGLTGDVGRTTSLPAAVPIADPPGAPSSVTGLVQAWRAASPGTAGPVVAGPAVATAEGDTVVGRDPVTGEQRWSYSRELPLCTVGTGFPGHDRGRVIALYESGTGVSPDGAAGDAYCSELTSLVSETGARGETRNPDARRGVRLLADDTYVLLTGTHHLEVLRSDLVRTLEYGEVPAQEQAGRQARPGCTYGSTALGGRRVGVVERCPGEDTDRLTVLAADGEDGAEQPQEHFSLLLPEAGATIVALTENRVAVALPGAGDARPAQLVVFDGTGAQVGVTDLDLPDGDLAADPAGGIAPTSTDGTYRYWFTGSSVVALTVTELSPVWTLPGVLGAPVVYGRQLLVPVSGGLAPVDRRLGAAGAVLPVARDDVDAPVSVAAVGEVLLEQRGDELVALLPG